LAIYEEKDFAFTGIKSLRLSGGKPLGGDGVLEDFE
jgi:hypothetical protein